MHVNEKRFYLSHYKSFSRFGTALHKFRKTMLDIEIFDLNRIDSLTEELSYNSRILSDSLPTYIWNNITNHHFYSFNNLYFKLFLSHKKNFIGFYINLTLTRLGRSDLSISLVLSYEHYKFIKQHHKNPSTSNNGTLIRTKIIPSNFFGISQDPLNNTNDKYPIPTFPHKFQTYCN